mmetsp:Transcript_39754/g.48227  ORF Transcript_39754/g.48227 Transcript_39754/m.48227 type:complete len:94 (+) Transcript_39754:119-400(+)|eukprot:CAMPEP_0197852714 /NCGR_PEP_ID=MMETSP1438-20131217/21251_1 /TAXON_ID=1461541 /ORGANISM="Pterosperma sp., Strain CCMP1384" /LENGTH=93 /DNA_ID=CAMNT_0043466875 /DNA_START=54 /DNA_END=335 /DNA_ORIENTATION=-
MRFLVTGSFDQHTKKNWNFFNPKDCEPEALDRGMGGVVSDFNKAYDTERYSELAGRKAEFDEPMHELKKKRQQDVLRKVYMNKDNDNFDAAEC